MVGIRQQEVADRLIGKGHRRRGEERGEGWVGGILRLVERISFVEAISFTFLGREKNCFVLVDNRGREGALCFGSIGGAAACGWHWRAVDRALFLW